MKYSGILIADVANYKGFRNVLFLSGCSHHCKGCHNPETWNPEHGNEFTEEIKENFFNETKKDYIQGITLSGGDPLFHPQEVLELLKEFREKFGDSKDVCLYSGYELDYILTHFKEIADLVDVIIDGKYIEELRDTSLAFRGSSNQTIWIKNKDGEFIKSDLNNKR